MDKNSVIAVAVSLVLAAAPAFAGPNKVNNQADVNHPDIHQKVGDGTNANPNGANANGGGIHGIGNNPGKSGASPRDGKPGFADQLETVHGGIGDVNKNAN
jgi:hypothetical protein